MLKNINWEKLINFSSKLLERYQYKLVLIIVSSLLLCIAYYLFVIIVRRALRFSLNTTVVSVDRIKTLSSIFQSILKVLLIFSIILLTFNILEIKLLPIIAGAGAVGAAIVIVFQEFIRDIIKGWILIFEDQYRKGEWIMINNAFTGEVTKLTLRTTVLQDKQGNIHIIPNGQIIFVSNLSRQLTHQSLRFWVKKEQPFYQLKSHLETTLNDFIANLAPEIRPISFKLFGPQKLTEHEYLVEINLKLAYPIKEKTTEQIRNFLLNKQQELGINREE
jgi:small conductance mechanosensitive channel